MIMKLLHTSDWHLGRALYDRKRYDEYAAFLNLLAGITVLQTAKKIDSIMSGSNQ